MQDEENNRAPYFFFYLTYDRFHGIKIEISPKFLDTYEFFFLQRTPNYIDYVAIEQKTCDFILKSESDLEISETPPPANISLLTYSILGLSHYFSYNSFSYARVFAQ